ncbi:MAG: energy transducer TonB [candidate division WOR-3 bacterium]
MRRLKPTEISLALSILFHLLLFLFFNSRRERVFSYEEIKEVSLIDQTYRPEVAKILPPPKEGFGPIEAEVPASVTGTGGGGEEVAYDLNRKLERSQAKIDLSRFETGEEMGAIRIADKIKGVTKTTEEILKEAPVPLTHGARRGTGGLGIAGYPGVLEEPAIKLETKPVEKPKEKLLERKGKEEVTSVLPSVCQQSAIVVSGPISERKILRKVLPRYPDWALKKGVSGTIIIRLWVTPEGDVRENMEVVESSGYPDLDRAVLMALASWKFAPLPENVKKETQWGLVTVRFELM